MPKTILNHQILTANYLAGSKTKSVMDDFTQGVFYAASILVTLNDQTTYAADILEQAGYLDADCSELDDSEKDAMRKLQEQDERCNFTGLDS